MTITVQGPDGSSVDFPDGTDASTISGVMTQHFGGPKAEPVTANKVARSFATGVPVVGGLLNKAEAATGALLAPVVEPFMAKGPDSLNDEPGATVLDRFGARYRKAEKIQSGMDERFATEHPIIDTAAKIAGGVAGSVPMMMAAPKAFGLTGTVREMAARGAASQAGLSAADAAVRGDDPVAAGLLGGAVGAAVPVVAKGAGKVVQAVRDMRNPPPVVPQTVEHVAGVDVPLSQGRATGSEAAQAREELARRGILGESAEGIAKQADAEALAAVEQARGNIGAQLDPTGATPRTAPQTAGEAVQAELAAQEQARAAAEAARGSQVAAEGANLARGLSGGTAPVSPFDAAEGTGAAVAAGRDAAVARTRAAYRARDAVPGTFADEVPAGLAEDIRARLNAGENPIHVDPTNETMANRALKLIDQTVGKNSGVLENAVLPKVPEIPVSAPRAAAAPAPVDDTVEALRKQYGDSVADAYARQNASAGTPIMKQRPDGLTSITGVDWRNDIPGGLQVIARDALPNNLAGAKPRYNIGENQYLPQFASDIDKAMFITAQSSKSAQDSAFRSWLKSNGYTDSEIANHGRAVRAAIKSRAMASESGPIRIDRVTPDANISQSAAKPPLSLLEFIASKGGLQPHAELDAIGLTHGHRTQVPGQSGFFGTVRKNGSEIDRMREAAEEAGYLHGENGATSTPTQFLDAIDTELRGQKLFPQGHEGFTGAKAAAGAREAERAGAARMQSGFEQDLHAAGHGELGPEMKDRAIALMRDEGMSADDAAETAFRQLEHEDAIRAQHAASDFPGDRPMLSLAQEAAQRPVDMKAMDEARKRLVTMYGDAKSAAIRSGDKSDQRAMAKILHEFDNVIQEALDSGKFSGDAALAAQLQRDARASHAEYKRLYSSRPGDEIGRAVEKILGRYQDTRATPEQIQSLSYGPASRPGTGDSIKVALRLRDILGENSAAWRQWRSGLLHYVDDPSLPMAKRAERIEQFLGSSMGRGGILTPSERATLQSYGRNMATHAAAIEAGANYPKVIERIIGGNGREPATVGETLDILFGANGKSNSKEAERALTYLKSRVKPETWTGLRQAAWEKLTVPIEGQPDFTALMKAKRIDQFLQEGGSKVLFPEGGQARASMQKFSALLKKFVPVEGVKNPSGSALVGARLVKHAQKNVLGMLGFATHGPVGAIVGHGLDVTGRTLKDARSAREAEMLFYGKQPKRSAPVSRLPILLRNAVPASQR